MLEILHDEDPTTQQYVRATTKCVDYTDRSGIHLPQKIKMIMTWESIIRPAMLLVHTRLYEVYAQYEHYNSR